MTVDGIAIGYNVAQRKRQTVHTSLILLQNKETSNENKDPICIACSNKCPLCKKDWNDGIKDTLCLHCIPGLLEYWESEARRYREYRNRIENEVVGWLKWLESRHRKGAIKSLKHARAALNAGKYITM